MGVNFIERSPIEKHEEEESYDSIFKHVPSNGIEVNGDLHDCIHSNKLGWFSSMIGNIPGNPCQDHTKAQQTDLDQVRPSRTAYKCLFGLQIFAVNDNVPDNIDKNDQPFDEIVVNDESKMVKVKLEQLPQPCKDIPDTLDAKLSPGVGLTQGLRMTSYPKFGFDFSEEKNIEQSNNEQFLSSYDEYDSQRQSIDTVRDINDVLAENSPFRRYVEMRLADIGEEDADKPKNMSKLSVRSMMG